jgi:hypothetical protein
MNATKLSKSNRDEPLTASLVKDRPDTPDATFCDSFDVLTEVASYGYEVSASCMSRGMHDGLTSEGSHGHIEGI